MLSLELCSVLYQKVLGYILRNNRSSTCHTLLLATRSSAQPSSASTQGWYIPYTSAQLYEHVQDFWQATTMKRLQPRP